MIKAKTLILEILIAGIMSFKALTSPAYAIPENTILNPVKISSPVTIDGLLDETVWTDNPPLTHDFITYNPRAGDILPQNTSVWMAYDSENIYFAFHCFDTEPEKIKTSITQRDKIFNDDWVGISLDTQGNKQSSYDLFVNPNGIQADISNSINAGEDTASDWVWDSAGRITDDGYQVEMCIPLKSIRFRSGKEVEMGILFWRRISRLGMSGSWPELKPGLSTFYSLCPASFRNLKTRRNVQFLPNVTYSNTRERKNLNSWNGADITGNVGMGFSYSLSSSVTTEATFNPDFSQVESDAFQIDVNQRYPIFYSEKRPFFLEVRNLFEVINTGINSAVYTRRIVDPVWGVKLTGSEGKTSFGIMAAEDAWRDPDLAISGDMEPSRFAAARSKYSIRGDNYIGGIYTGHTSNGEYNHVVGIDGVLRFGAHQGLGYSTLQSITSNNEKNEVETGNSSSIIYIYETKPLFFRTTMERFSPDFTMDTAFYNRTGYQKGNMVIARNFYTNFEKYTWIRRITPAVSAWYLHDLRTGMNDREIALDLQAHFTRQGYAEIVKCFNGDAWEGKYYKYDNLYLYGTLQTTNWLGINGNLSTGKSIYYDEEDPFVGKSRSCGARITLQPGSRFTEALEYRYSDLRHPDDNHLVYNVNIINTKTTYQFNKYIFVRTILQYNSYSKTLLEDFLVSCTVIPGTVVHIGYGGLYRENDWKEDSWIDGEGKYRVMKRSFFFKTSYLQRF